MARKDVEQFNLRLNLNNPNHLKIYRTFQDLNTDIHKSRNNFIIEALLRYINGISEEDLTITGAKKKQEADRYVTQSEIAELETRITAKVMKEVAEMMGRAALGNQGMMINPMMMQSYMQMAQTTQQEAPKENETKDVTEEEDATLQEMSLMFAQGEFGNSSHGTPCAMKVACTVWLGAKGVKASDLSRFLLNSEYSAKYLQQLWKKVRKQGGLCTGITQNVVDLLQNYTATTMLANSEFVALLKQANTDSSKMAEVIGVSDAQLRFVTNSQSGMGLLKCGNVVIPFDNQIGKDTSLYKLYNTNIHEKIAEQRAKENAITE